MSVSNSTAAIKEGPNIKQFHQFYGNAILVEKGGFETTQNQELTSLSAYNCIDDIAVFAIKKMRGKNMCMMGWRFSNESQGQIRKNFEELLEPKDVCDFYIVGGDSDTTQSENCLLDRIHLAIKDFFIENGKHAKVVKEHTNLNLNSKFKYVTAKLKIDGKLTYCRHEAAINPEIEKKIY